MHGNECYLAVRDSVLVWKYRLHGLKLVRGWVAKSIVLRMDTRFKQLIPKNDHYYATANQVKVFNIWDYVYETVLWIRISYARIKPFGCWLLNVPLLSKMKCTKLFRFAFETFMILFEVMDKGVDVYAVLEYDRWRLSFSGEPKKSIYIVFIVITVIGCLISVVRISCCIWSIFRLIKADNLHECERKLYDTLFLIISAKVVLEAFPQAVFAAFFFISCPVKKYCWEIESLNPAFDAFCTAPFIFFWVTFFCCIWKYPCRCDNESERLKAIIKVVILSVPATFSLVGLGFAVASIREFALYCS